MDTAGYTFAPASETDRTWIDRESEDIGGPVIVSAGRLHDLREFPAMVVSKDARHVGFVVYRIDGESLEILAIKAMQKHQGVGSALLTEVEQIAYSTACSVIWLCTTNANLDTLRFYQRRGFAVRAYRPNAVQDVPRLKGLDPDLQLDSHYGIPVRDEIELSKSLQRSYTVRHHE
jgi:GNAT superfamily N-acetyltransferase